MTTDYMPLEPPTYTIEKIIVGYAYARNGNAHNPTPKIEWVVKNSSGKIVDRGPRKRELCNDYRIPFRS